ncbi:pentraxin-related protein PTX3 [Brachyistius frenatus]|uniref:pentraxin-related protein PTX3 n=1 Tax=Brachyistius frenatus TaxID=100188 RepID=UPI0037E94E2C
MFRCRLLQAVLSVCLCLALAAYEDDIEVNYDDTYYNEITEGGETAEPTPSSSPCSSSDLTKWDKMFSMLENSQMRENMLLQYADDIIKVEMGSLRSEMLSFVAQYGGSCGVAVETAGRRMASQMEGRLRETLERLKLGDLAFAAAGKSAGNSYQSEALLQQLLSATRAQVSRLAKLETSCFRSPGVGMGMNTKTGSQLPESGGEGSHEQEVTSRQAVLDKTLAAVLEMKGALQVVLRSSRQRNLPAGCEMALLFPMRSRRIYTAVIPDVPMSLSSFTVCMWVKPTAVSNQTVLFSYGTPRNPYEIQLLLGQTSALFTVGGEAHLVEARGVVKLGQWLHLCGTWSSKQGRACLWADGKTVASTPGVAEGHVLPDGGSLQLGQERNGCCPTSPRSGNGVAGFEGGFNPKLSFAGKMTGVNMWDRILSGPEINTLAFQEGQVCDLKGNMVAWGVTEMVPHGGAQFIY